VLGAAASEDDWPVVFDPSNVCIGGVQELEAALGQRRAHQQLREERVALETRREKARLEERPEEGRALEESLHVLDMRLSVLGDQFRERARDRGTAFPDLSKELSWSADDHFGSSEDPASPPARTSTPPALRTVDVALESLEWAVLKGYDWVQTMVVGSSESSSSPGADAVPRDATDFEVLQTNWYWRQQKRLLRVTGTELLRIHPMTGDVRKRILLSDIVSIVVAADRLAFKLVLKGETAAPESYQSQYTQQLVDMVARRAPNVKIIEEG